MKKLDRFIPLLTIGWLTFGWLPFVFTQNLLWLGLFFGFPAIVFVTALMVSLWVGAIKLALGK